VTGLHSVVTFSTSYECIETVGIDTVSIVGVSKTIKCHTYYKSRYIIFVLCVATISKFMVDNLLTC